MDDSKITELYVSGSEQALSETSFGRDTQCRFTAAISSHKVHCQQLSNKVPAEGFLLLPVVVLFDYSIGFKNVIRFVIGVGAQVWAVGRGYAEPFYRSVLSKYITRLSPV